jgi:hypothetical protein
MGKGFAILFSVLLLLATTTANASITGVTCVDDHDTAITMDSYQWGPAEGGEYYLTMNCTQFWGPGHVSGDITAPDDPTLRITQYITNDTTFEWTDYHITIGMNKTFSFVSGGLVMPDGWTANIIGPTDGLPLPGDTPHGTGWVATINYVMGPEGSPIALDAEGMFGFKVLFAGSVEYCTAQVPTPEPATIGLLGLGAMALLRRRKA